MTTQAWADRHTVEWAAEVDATKVSDAAELAAQVSAEEEGGTRRGLEMHATAIRWDALTSA